MIGDISMDRLVLLFDAVTAILLLATIAYAAILHSRLSVLRESRQELEQLMARFTEDDILAKAFKGPQSKTKMLISRPMANKR